jgi:hypothetical protein
LVRLERACDAVRMHDAATAQDTSAGQWMTYAELASARGVSYRAAVRTTQRQRLRRQPGNDGKVRVWVTPDVAQPPQGAQGGAHAQRIHPDVRQSVEISALSDAVTALREANTGLVQTLDRVLAQQADTQAQVERERARADQAIDRERAWWSMPRWRRLLDAWKGA